jgi:hypothetical protein
VVKLFKKKEKPAAITEIRHGEQIIGYKIGEKEFYETDFYTKIISGVFKAILPKITGAAENKSVSEPMPAPEPPTPPAMPEPEKILIASKHCPKCDAVKPITEFQKNTRICRECKRAEYIKRTQEVKQRYVKREKPAVASGDKFCIRCETIQPQSEFYLCSSSKDKLYSYCKTCVKANDAARKAKKSLKQCSNCGKSKPIELFYSRRNVCKSCFLKQQKKRYKRSKAVKEAHGYVKVNVPDIPITDATKEDAIPLVDSCSVHESAVDEKLLKRYKFGTAY